MRQICDFLIRFLFILARQTKMNRKIIAKSLIFPSPHLVPTFPNLIGEQKWLDWTKLSPNGKKKNLAITDNLKMSNFDEMCHH